MEYDLDDYINLLALKNQLVNADVKVLVKDYKEDFNLFIQFLDSVIMLLSTDSGFLLFSKESCDKIFEIINIHRFDCDDKEVVACINEVIGEINRINSTSPELKKLMMEQYLAYNEEIRQINILDGETLVQLIAFDALCLFSLNSKEDVVIKDKEEYMMLSSINYLVQTCPELFKDEDIKKNAEKAIDIITKKGGIFNFKEKKYSKKTKENFQKVKSMKKEDE